MKPLFSRTTKRVLIRISDLWLYPEPLFGQLHTGPFQFLGDSGLYNAQQTMSGTDPEGMPFCVRPLSRRIIEENKFMHFLMMNTDSSLTCWDRQAPFRLFLPLRIGCRANYANIGARYGQIRTYTYPPEILLFPAGWSTLLKFSLEGSVPIGALHDLCSLLLTEPVLFLHPDRGQYDKCETLVNHIGRRVSNLIHLKSVASAPRRLLGYRISSILDHEPPDIDASRRSYMTKDWLVMLSNIRTGQKIDIVEVPKLQRVCLSAQHGKGMVVGQYGKGFFVDLPFHGPRSIRCFSHNLQYFIIMAELLQSFINTGVKLLQHGRCVERYPFDAVVRFYDLIATSRRVLESLNDGYRLSIAQAYLKNHGGVTSALRQDLETLGRSHGLRGRTQSGT